jgi:hypothetical protein
MGAVHPALAGSLGPNTVYEPKLLPQEGGWLYGSDESVSYPVRSALCPIVNASLQTRTVDWPTTPSDPVNIATGLAGLSQLLVLAAGNLHQYAAPGQESMSAWAEMPWVLAVGATQDAAGTRLAEYSGRGIQQIADSGPDIVAFGESIFTPEEFGTSFAAPRVARGALLCTAVVEQLRFRLQQLRGDAELRGVPLIGLGLLDVFGDAPLPMRLRMPVPALPPLAVDGEALAKVVSALDESSIALDFAPTPARLRWMLQASAQPMPSYGPHEVGVGFYSEERLLEWLAAFNGAQLAWVFGTGNAPAGSEALRALSDVRPLIADEIEKLARVVGDTMPVWRFDWKTGAFSMRGDEG